MYAQLAEYCVGFVAGYRASCEGLPACAIPVALPAAHPPKNLYICPGACGRRAKKGGPAAAANAGIKCSEGINRESRAMGKSTKRPVGTRYGAAYVVKIAFDSLGLSFVLPYAGVVLLRLGCIAAGVMPPVKGIYGAVIAMVILALVFALYCYALPNHPERFSGLPRGAFYGENMRLFVPILEGYCGILIHMICLELALMAVFFLWWPVGIISDLFWISSIFVLAISMIPYLLMPHLLDKEIRRREGAAREAFVAGELEHLQEARRGVLASRVARVGRGGADLRRAVVGAMARDGGRGGGVGAVVDRLGRGAGGGGAAGGRAARAALEARGRER